VKHRILIFLAVFIGFATSALAQGQPTVQWQAVQSAINNIQAKINALSASTLPSINASNAGQFALVNSAGNAYQLVSLSGDLTCSSSVPGQCKVVGINSVPLLGSLTLAGQSWCYNGSSGMIPCSGSGGTPGGPNLSIQFNNGGSFGGYGLGSGLSVAGGVLNTATLDLLPSPAANVNFNGFTATDIAAATLNNEPLAYGQAAAVLTSLTASVNGVIDVTAPPYNADLTGANDSLPGIQAAIYAGCNSANPPSGTPTLTATASVYIPAGTYLHSAPFRIPCRNLDIGGAGLATQFTQNYAGMMGLAESWGAPGALPYDAAAMRCITPIAAHLLDLSI
jgi:hypothetical protein